MSRSRGDRFPEERVKRAVSGLQPARPDDDFRASLRGRFVSGELAEAADARSKILGPLGGPAFWIPVAAAAALVVFVVLGRGPQWSVQQAAAPGWVEIEEGTIPLPGLTDRPAALNGGTVLKIPRGNLELRIPGTLSMRITEGTEMVLPTAPRKWFPRKMFARIDEGEILVLTGPDFPGVRLEVETPEGLVRVAGTAFAVWRDPSATCVCVLEGSASVGIDEADMEDVPPGQRKVMFHDGRPSQVMDVEPGHRAGLEEFVQRSRPLLGAVEPAAAGESP